MTFLINELTILTTSAFSTLLKVFCLSESSSVLILASGSNCSHNETVKSEILVLRFLQICNSVICTWPPDLKFELAYRKIHYNFTILNTIVIKMTLIYTIYKYWHDVTIIMKVLTKFACVVELLVNLCICRLKSARIQVRT